MATAATGQGATMSTAAPTTSAATKATMPRSTPRTGNGETASMRVASTRSVVATTTSVIRVAMAAPSNDRAGMSHRFSRHVDDQPDQCHRRVPAMAAGGDQRRERQSAEEVGELTGHHQLGGVGGDRVARAVEQRDDRSGEQQELGHHQGAGHEAQQERTTERPVEGHEVVGPGPHQHREHRHGERDRHEVHDIGELVGDAVHAGGGEGVQPRQHHDVDAVERGGEDAPERQGRRLSQQVLPQRPVDPVAGSRSGGSR